MFKVRFHNAKTSSKLNKTAKLKILFLKPYFMCNNNTLVLLKLKVVSQAVISFILSQNVCGVEEQVMNDE